MSDKAALRAVAWPVPMQTDLPFPDPPKRPFVSLARMCKVGGPMLKHVFNTIVGYCPVMAIAEVWSVTGDAVGEFNLAGRWDEDGERGELPDGTVVSRDAPIDDPDNENSCGERLTGWRRPYTWSEVGIEADKETK